MQILTPGTERASDPDQALPDIKARIELLEYPVEFFCRVDFRPNGPHWLSRMPMNNSTIVAFASSDLFDRKGIDQPFGDTNEGGVWHMGK